MNFRLAIVIAMTAVAGCQLTGAAPQKEQSSPVQGQLELRDQAVATATMNVSGSLAFGQTYQTSLVVVITYKYPNGDDVRVLFGPNEGEREIAEGRITSNGDFYVERGFAYMHYETTASATSTQPANSRPYIRTKRVNAVGEGSSWAVQVNAVHDRVFFVGGDKVKCESEINGEDYELDDSSKQTFTQVPDHLPTSTTNPFTAEASYMTHSGASAFAAYVDTFHPLYGMPQMR